LTLANAEQTMALAVSAESIAGRPMNLRRTVGIRLDLSFLSELARPSA
jgi:hypothetical protein